MKVKVTRNSSSPVEVMGLGLIEPNTWVEVTPEQEAAFEALQGKTLEESDLETQAGSSSSSTTVTRVTRATTPPVEETQETPAEDDNDEGGEE